MSPRLRSKKDQVKFLLDHFRYDTMSSWNQSTSYANKVKVHSLDLRNEEQDRVYEALGVDGVYEESGYNWAIEEWTREQGGWWTIGQNGRSGGYLVLYDSKYEYTEHKSACNVCGQLNYKEVLGDGPGKCGRCGAQARHNVSPIQRLSISSGKEVDQYEEFLDWSAQDVAERYHLIKSFDAACNGACLAFLNWAMSHRIEEEVISVPQTVKVAVPV